MRVATYYNEHYSSFKLDSTFANHILDSTHKFPERDKLNILGRQEKRRSSKLNMLQSIEIYKVLSL